MDDGVCNVCLPCITTSFSQIRGRRPKGLTSSLVLLLVDLHLELHLDLLFHFLLSLLILDLYVDIDPLASSVAKTSVATSHHPSSPTFGASPITLTQSLTLTPLKAPRMNTCSITKSKEPLAAHLLLLSTASLQNHFLSVFRATLLTARYSLSN